MRNVAITVAILLTTMLSACSKSNQDRDSEKSPTDNASQKAGEESKPEKETPTEAKEIAKTYTDANLLTSSPYLLPSLQPAAACDSAVFDETEEHGPHAYHSLNIFSNLKSSELELKGEEEFGVGTFFVKQKLDFDNVVGVGGMIKRDKNYDPQNGNWEYFYFEDTKNLTDFSTGSISSCVECHSKQKTGDRVFATWKSSAKEN